MPLIKLSFTSAKRYSNNPNWIKFGPYKQYGKAGTSGIPVTCSTRTLCIGNDIPMHCIANMIAVLMGDRPVPKHRTTAITDTAYMQKYYAIANRTYINVKTDINNTSIQQTNKEVYSNKKVMPQSIMLDGQESTIYCNTPSHSIMELGMGKEYPKFNEMCIQTLGNEYKLNFTFLQTITELRKLYKMGDEHVKNWVTSNSKWNIRILNYIIDPIITGKIGISSFNFARGWQISGVPAWVASTNTHGIEKNVQTMCGEIAINVTEAELDQIKHGNGMATLMDGGVVKIEEISYWESKYENWRKPVTDEEVHKDGYRTNQH